MAIYAIVVFALTFKARGTAERVLRTVNSIQSFVLSHEKQVLSLQMLVSEQLYLIHTVDWSTAHLHGTVHN